jgi:hypothetical protein
MDAAALDKMRTTPLVLAAIVFTLAIAGIRVDSPVKIAPLGLPLTVTRPDLIPIGIICAAFYSAIRYLYYTTAWRKSVS